MASPAEIIRALLVKQGLVAMPGVTGQTIPVTQQPGDGSAVCFVSSMPDEMDQAVCVNDMVGLSFGTQQSTGKMLLHYGLKVIVRALDHPTGFALAVAIAGDPDSEQPAGLRAMAGQSVVVDDVSYFIQNVYRTGTVVYLGEETGKKRMLWAINARVAMGANEPILG